MKILPAFFSGGGVFVLFTATGKGAVTADGETFDWIDTETPVASAVRCGCSGNSSFLVGTDRGEIILSVSLAQLFATVSQGDFQQFTDETDEKVDQQIGEIKETHEAFVEEANKVLSRKPNLGLPYSLPVTCHLYEDNENFPEPCEHLDDDGEPLLDSGGFPYAADAYCPKCFPWNMIEKLQSGGLSTQRAAPEFHWHSDENLVRRAWLGRPTPQQQDPRHPMTGVATLDDQGKLPESQATWMRDAASGIAALDANRKIFRDYLPTNYDVDLLMNALRGGMVENWFLINNPIFEDIGGFSRIYAIDYVREWLAHYRAVGFEKFAVVLHDCSDETEQRIRSLSFSDDIEIGHTNRPYPQVGVYHQLCKDWRDKTYWMAFLDSDEFLFCPTGTDVRSFMTDYEKHSGLMVHHYEFGSSGHVIRPEGLSITSFLYRAKDNHWLHDQFKSIIRLDKYQKYLGPHMAQLEGDFVREDHRAVPKENIFFNHGLKNGEVPICRKIRYNHYHNRSMEDFVARSYRGDACREPQPLTCSHFKMRDHRDVLDFEITRYERPIMQLLEGRIR